MSKKKVAESGILVDQALGELSAAQSRESSKYDHYFRILAANKDPETPFHNVAMRLRLKLRELNVSISMKDPSLVNTVLVMLNPKNFSVGTIGDFLKAFQQILESITEYKTNNLVSECAGLILEFIDEINKFPEFGMVSEDGVSGRPALLFPDFTGCTGEAAVASTGEKTI